MRKFFLTLAVAFLILGAYRFCKYMLNANDSGTEDNEVVVEAVEEQGENKSDWENSPHLRFKSVPIDGTLKQFVSRMKQTGFEKVAFISDAGSAVLTGDFAGFKDCKVKVSTLDNRDLVSTITVTFPEREQWKYLNDDYKTLKNLLVEKYGAPASSVERFTGSYTIGDDDKMYDLQFGRCEYKTTFSTKAGEIVLSIEHEGMSKCFVQLCYKDRINSGIIKDVAIGDL